MGGHWKNMEKDDQNCLGCLWQTVRTLKLENTGKGSKSESYY